MYVIAAVLAVCVWVGSQAAPAADQITHLPGLNHAIAFKHYSGYLSGDTGKHLHYWFVESSRDPVGDPVVLWMNGGPGCSSMEGLLAELGPYLINPDGKTLKQNPYAWNNMANVLFLEAPACVGLSYDDHGQCATGDDETSLSNYLALQDFFTNKFPEYRNNSFFITGESYAGIYVPTLAVRVLQGEQKFPINLQGYAIGNGLSSYELNDDSIIFFAYYHGLFGDDLWVRLVEHCCKGSRASKQTCNFHSSKWPMCTLAVNKASRIIYMEGLNMYNLYDDCPHTTAGKLSRHEADLSNVMRHHSFHDTMMTEAAIKYTVNLDPPCTNGTNLLAYLNTPEVRQALHIPLDVPRFELCNDEVNANYKREYTTMKPQYKYLTSRVRGLIYNGDIDMACNFLGDEWFVESLGLQVKESRKTWHQGGQVGGYVKRFANLDLVTIRGAGHMVPEDKSAPALKMLTSFLFQKPY
ncbi:Lysosomal protective protein [Chionoecetes opilio]|uniref:Carboxypeptidase n=1 Tax=Chionoecetes opilio TaxID=41210 RepID=A0A8J5CM43_CHIOP|nr:Lysosomal protective protein [Chionoecetes opilio]